MRQAPGNSSPVLPGSPIGQLEPIQSLLLPDFDHTFGLLSKFQENKRLLIAFATLCHFGLQLFRDHPKTPVDLPPASQGFHHHAQL